MQPRVPTATVVGCYVVCLAAFSASTFQPVCVCMHVSNGLPLRPWRPCFIARSKICGPMLCGRSVVSSRWISRHAEAVLTTLRSTSLASLEFFKVAQNSPPVQLQSLSAFCQWKQTTNVVGGLSLSSWGMKTYWSIAELFVYARH